MSKLTINDRNETITQLETQFRQDLSLHLYSAVLLRKIDPLFPNTRWSSWPLPPNEAPIPKSTIKYCDTPFSNTTFPTDINTDHSKWQTIENNAKIDFYHNNMKPLPKYLKKYNQSLKKPKEPKSKSFVFSDSDLDSFEIESDQDIEIEDANEIYTTNMKQKIEDFTITETITNSKAELLNDIHALIEKKLHQQIKKGKTLHIENSDVAKFLAKKVAKRIDDSLSNVDKMPIPKQIPPKEKKNWQNIFLASMEPYSPYTSFKNKRLQNLYFKFESMFEDIRYNYEFDDDENDYQHIVTSAGFNVTNYLNSLKNVDQKYVDLMEVYAERRLQKTNRYDALKHIILDRLDISRAYNDLNWKNKRLKTKMTLTDDLDDLKRQLLDPKRVGLDSSSYLLGSQYDKK